MEVAQEERECSLSWMLFLPWPGNEGSGRKWRKGLGLGKWRHHRGKAEKCLGGGRWTLLGCWGFDEGC